jgi:predicted Zn-ribbon and HTH transcriptional regulator
MKFIRLIPAFLITVAALTGLWSCGGSKEDQNNADEFDQAEQSLKEQVETVIGNLPPPTEIPYLIQMTGAEYNQSLLNDRNKVDKYFSRNDKAALNLGIYAADIGYLSSYDKTQEAIDYLDAAKKLADNLGVIGSFNMDVLQRFEQNIANKDSLANILNRAILSSEKYLKDESRTKLAALLLTGSFVEGLYISTGLIKSYPKDILPEDSRNLVLTPLMRVILQQELSVDELLNMINTLEKDELLTSLATDLTSLQSSYRALNIEEQIKNNRSDLVLSDKNLEEITKVVEKMRTSIVE